MSQLYKNYTEKTKQTNCCIIITATKQVVVRAATLTHCIAWCCQQLHINNSMTLEPLPVDTESFIMIG